MPLNSQYPVQAAFSVPKKHFKKSVDRNRIKRLVRESYRFNKRLLYQRLVDKKDQIALMIIYQGKELPSFREIDEKIRVALDKLILNHEENYSTTG